jgi:hypothetical protein
MFASSLTPDPLGLLLSMAAAWKTFVVVEVMNLDRK